MLIALHDLNQALRYRRQCMVIANGRLAACGTLGGGDHPGLLRDIYRSRRGSSVLARHRSCRGGWRRGRNGSACDDGGVAPNLGLISDS